MRILILGMNYWPERTSVGPFTTELCDYLVAIGHHVQVVTSFPHYPEWQVYQAYNGRWWHHEHHSGVDIYRGYVYVPKKGKPRAWQRILYDSTFSVSALIWGLALGRADVILAVGPPLQIGVTAYLLSIVKRCPFGFLMHDIVPDAAVQAGMLHNRWAIRIASQMEQFVYQKALAIAVICQGFFENLQKKGVPSAKVHVLPNWVDTDLVRPVSSPSAFRRANGLNSEHFLVLHAGNMGAKQGLENVIQAARYIRHLADLRVLLVGDGSERNMLEHRIAGDGNIRILPLQPVELLSDMLSSAGVLVVNQRIHVVDMSLPSKIIKYMAAGRPIVAAVHERSETARCIRDANCGLIVPPDNPPALAQAIQRLYADPELAKHLGQRGRIYAEEHFARDKVLRRYAELFETIAGRTGRQELLSTARQETV